MDVKVGFAVDSDAFELSGAGQGVDDVANAGPGCERGEEGLDVGLGGEERLREIEADEGGKGGGLSGVGTSLELFGEAGGDRLPECGAAGGVGDGEDAEVLPELAEGAEDGGLGDLLAECGGEVRGAGGDRFRR